APQIGIPESLRREKPLSLPLENPVEKGHEYPGTGDPSGHAMDKKEIRPGRDQLLKLSRNRRQIGRKARDSLLPGLFDALPVESNPFRFVRFSPLETLDRCQTAVIRFHIETGFNGDVDDPPSQCRLGLGQLLGIKGSEGTVSIPATHGGADNGHPPRLCLIDDAIGVTAAEKL